MRDLRPPHELVDALHDRVHRDTGADRPGRSSRTVAVVAREEPRARVTCHWCQRLDAVTYLVTQLGSTTAVICGRCVQHWRSVGRQWGA